MKRQWFFYVGKRIASAIVILFILITIVYFLMDSLPYLPIQQGDKETSQQFYDRLESLGLTQNVWTRYFKYLGGLFSGNFGLYYENPQVKIVNLFFETVPSTMYIAGTAFIFSIFIGFTFGIIAAIYRGKMLDTLVNVLSVIFVSVPSFIFAIILLKIGGMIGLPLTFVSPSSHNFTFTKMVLSSILPITALIFGLASTLTYYVRNELIDVLNQEYIKTAKAKGLSNSQVLWKHAMRNIMIPTLSIIAPSFLYVISGSVVIENFFGISGISTLLVKGITMRETNLIEFQTLFFSGLYFIIQIILDITYTFIDPRIQLVESRKNVFLFTKIINLIKRGLWNWRWRFSSSPDCLWVKNDSEVYSFLWNQCLLSKNKKNWKIVLKTSDCDKYKELKGKNYLVIERNIFKIKYSECA